MTWLSIFPFFQINPYPRIGPLSAYNGEILTIDGNTGAQLDFPPHSVPAPGTNLPNAGPLGLIFGEKVPAWQFVGEACVIDVSDLIDKAPDGKSSLIYKVAILNWKRNTARSDSATSSCSGVVTVTSIFRRSLTEGGLRQTRLKAKQPAGRTPIQK